MRRLLLLGLFMLPGIVSSQQTRASISKSEALIGERILLSFSVPISKGQKIEFVPEKKFLNISIMNDSGKVTNAPLETMEILKPFRDTVIDAEGGEIWTGLYEVTVWDSGTFIIQNKKIKLGKELILFPRITLTGKLAPVVNGIENYDIEEYFSKLPEERLTDLIWRFLKEYGWIILIVLAGLVIWWIKRRKQILSDKHIPTPLELCLKEIDALSAKKLWEKDATKEHYVDLSMILRSYLSDCYSVNLTERTTQEALILLKKKAVSKALFENINSFLEEADLVKFAKFIPQEKDILKHLDLAKTIVNSVELTPGQDEV